MSHRVSIIVTIEEIAIIFGVSETPTITSFELFAIALTRRLDDNLWCRFAMTSVALMAHVHRTESIRGAIILTPTMVCSMELVI